MIFFLVGLLILVAVVGAARLAAMKTAYRKEKD